MCRVAHLPVVVDDQCRIATALDSQSVPPRLRQDQEERGRKTVAGRLDGKELLSRLFCPLNLISFTTQMFYLGPVNIANSVQYGVGTRVTNAGVCSHLTVAKIKPGSEGENTDV